MSESAPACSRRLRRIILTHTEYQHISSRLFPSQFQALETVSLPTPWRTTQPRPFQISERACTSEQHRITFRPSPPHPGICLCGLEPRSTRAPATCVHIHHRARPAPGAGHLRVPSGVYRTDAGRPAAHASPQSSYPARVLYRDKRITRPR